MCPTSHWERSCWSFLNKMMSPTVGLPVWELERLPRWLIWALKKWRFPSHLDFWTFPPGVCSAFIHLCCKIVNSRLWKNNNGLLNSGWGRETDVFRSRLVCCLGEAGSSGPLCTPQIFRSVISSKQLTLGFLNLKRSFVGLDACNETTRRESAVVPVKFDHAIS